MRNMKANQRVFVSKSTCICEILVAVEKVIRQLVGDFLQHLYNLHLFCIKFLGRVMYLYLTRLRCHIIMICYIRKDALYVNQANASIVNRVGLLCIMEGLRF